MDVGAVEGAKIERRDPPRLSADCLTPVPSTPRARLPVGRTLVALGAMTVVVVTAARSISFSELAGADARVEARQAETALEAFASQHGGTYAGATAGELRSIDPRLGSNVEVQAAGTSYTVTVATGEGAEFRIQRLPDGSSLLSCEPAGVAGCPPGGAWR